MQDFMSSVIFLLLAILTMDAAAAPPRTGSSTRAPSLRRRTNHTSNPGHDEFFGDDIFMMNRAGLDQSFADDGGALMEHSVLTDDGQVQNLELVGSENGESLWRVGNSEDETVFFNNEEDDFLPESEDKANDEFLEPKMLLSPGEEVNENLKGPGYDWSVMGKVRKVTTQKPQESNIHFIPEEETDEIKPWETGSRPRPDSSS